MEAESPDELFSSMKEAAAKRLGDTARADKTTVSVPPGAHGLGSISSLLKATFAKVRAETMPHGACMTPGGLAAAADERSMGWRDCH